MVQTDVHREWAVYRMVAEKGDIKQMDAGWARFLCPPYTLRYSPQATDALFGKGVGS